MSVSTLQPDAGAVFWAEAVATSACTAQANSPDATSRECHVVHGCAQGVLCSPSTPMCCRIICKSESKLETSKRMDGACALHECHATGLACPARCCGLVPCICAGVSSAGRHTSSHDDDCDHMLIGIRCMHCMVLHQHHTWLAAVDEAHGDVHEILGGLQPSHHCSLRELDCTASNSNKGGQADTQSVCVNVLGSETHTCTGCLAMLSARRCGV